MPCWISTPGLVISLPYVFETMFIIVALYAVNYVRLLFSACLCNSKLSTEGWSDSKLDSLLKPFTVDSGLGSHSNKLIADSTLKSSTVDTSLVKHLHSFGFLYKTPRGVFVF